MTARELINVDPEIMDGVPVFRVTRVPIQHLLDHLESNSTIDEFLAGFPTVSMEQVVATLKIAARLLTAANLNALYEAAA